jgi:uncharacterized membrane protein YedE/YeeE
MSLPIPFLDAVIGGALIGLATAGLAILNGRLAGISGVIEGALGSGRAAGWQLCFVAGLALGGVVARLIAPAALGPVAASLPALAMAGALVGFGTRLSGGCTSGHGVCGIARVSKRSLAATGVFMAVAALVVYLVRRGAGS